MKLNDCFCLSKIGEPERAAGYLYVSAIRIGYIVTYKKPDGGLAFWIKPVKEVDLFKLKEKANSELLSFYTPDRFSFDKPVLGLRIGYASLSESNIEKGILVLEKLL